jgi:hypothetical protein
MYFFFTNLRQKRFIILYRIITDIKYAFAACNISPSRVGRGNPPFHFSDDGGLRLALGGYFNP